MSAYLIEGEMRLLVDTGLAPDHLYNPQVRVSPDDMVVECNEEDLIGAQLSAIGRTIDDIDAVVMTHLDFDHSGGNRLFEGRPIYVQRAHFEFARAVPERCFPDDWRHHGLKYELLDGDQELIAGVRVIETSGHVPGHQSVIVDLQETGAVILAGDAALTTVMFDEERVAGSLDPEATLESIRRLKAIRAETGGLLIIGHDADGWRDDYRAAPHSYT